MVDLLSLLFIGSGVAVAYDRLKKRMAGKKKKTLTPEVLMEIIDYEKTIASIGIFRKMVDSYGNSYTSQTSANKVLSDYNDLYASIKQLFDSYDINDPCLQEFLLVYDQLLQGADSWNENYVSSELAKTKALLDDVDGKSLDRQQRLAVITDEDNNLIVAGAGSGKTLTIAAKVKYLVERKGVPADKILLLAYTKKAAEEMRERIGERLGIQASVKTFHKLGLDIIVKVENRAPDIDDGSGLKKIIEEFFRNAVKKDPQLMRSIVQYFGSYITLPREDFQTLGEKFDYYRDFDFETLKSKVDRAIEALKEEKTTVAGERVKSVEEVLIANYLFLNGIQYTYEKTYPFSYDGEKHRRSYKPDFYLDDYDIYLEHFGINKSGRTPWLNEIEEKKYIAGIEWKRNLHEENNTILLETYSHYNSDGILYEKLDELFEEHGIECKEIEYEEIYELLFADNKNRQFSEFKKLIFSFITLFKSNEWNAGKFEYLLKVANRMNPFIKKRTHLFLDFVKPIYTLYQNYLNQNDTIDFNDMINLAKKYVADGHYKPALEYIIIDEYQDISMARFNLVEALQNAAHCKTMCVGDDWQSIFRFAGSNIYLFVNFPKKIGGRKMLRIEKTYRNSQELIDIAGAFIEKNPDQITKRLTSEKRLAQPIVVLHYEPGKQVNAIGLAIEKIIAEYGESTYILLLGRTNYDLEILKASSTFKVKGTQISYHPYPRVRIEFSTVHKAKGLEADNVIIINLEDDLLGFPNKISDDPVLSLVLSEEDNYDFSEERRLFYVALTRTKNRVFLIANEAQPSIFVKELRKNRSIPYILSNGMYVEEGPPCPKCKGGFLMLRENSKSGNQFLGCTNFPQCDYTVSDVNVLSEKKICAKCGSYLVKKNGPHGEFYGCSSYPHCDYTTTVIVDYNATTHTNDAYWQMVAEQYDPYGTST